MSEALTISNATTMDKSLVALAPGDLGDVQQQLLGWCRHRIVELGKELRDFRGNLRQARQMHWRRTSWERLISKTKAKMIYYVKIKAAVEAGYLLVPNFPAEVMAVRVDRHSPKFKQGYYPTDVNETKPDLQLPPGEGRYVDEMLPTRDASYTTKNPDGSVKNHPQAITAGSYNEVPDFPMALVKPIVLEATQRAMALNIFDRISLAHGGRDMSKARRRSDPLVIGQIMDPSDRWSQKRVTFFIAWWLNVEDV